MSSKPTYACADPIDVRLQISALWIAVLFIFAYVDLFSLYRPDVREALDAGRIFVFDISEVFLLGVTAYIVVPSLMIFLSLVMAPPVNRWINIIVAVVYAITIVGSAVGEWTYFVMGSLIEAALLGLIVLRAYRWPTLRN